MNMERILLIGGGGHCKVVIDTIALGAQYEIAGILDVAEKVGSDVCGIPVIGDDSQLTGQFHDGVRHCFIAAGSTGTPALRRQLAQKALEAGFSFPAILHPAALVSPHARIGCGSYVAPNAVINAGAAIGEHCIINTGVVIEHDVVVGDFSHVAPGATISGDVRIGGASHIGAGAVVSHGINIGANAIIGAGSVVVGHIEDDVVAYGNPCRKARENANA